MSSTLLISPVGSTSYESISTTNETRQLITSILQEILASLDLPQVISDAVAKIQLKNTTDGSVEEVELCKKDYMLKTVQDALLQANAKAYALDLQNNTNYVDTHLWPISQVVGLTSALSEKLAKTVLLEGEVKGVYSTTSGNIETTIAPLPLSPASDSSPTSKRYVDQRYLEQQQSNLNKFENIQTELDDLQNQIDNIDATHDAQGFLLTGAVSGELNSGVVETSLANVPISKIEDLQTKLDEKLTANTIKLTGAVIGSLNDETIETTFKPLSNTPSSDTEPASVGYVKTQSGLKYNNVIEPLLDIWNNRYQEFVPRMDMPIVFSDHPYYHNNMRRPTLTISTSIEQQLGTYYKSYGYGTGIDGYASIEFRLENKRTNLGYGFRYTPEQNGSGTTVDEEFSLIYGPPNLEDKSFYSVYDNTQKLEEKKIFAHYPNKDETVFSGNVSTEKAVTQSSHLTNKNYVDEEIKRLKAELSKNNSPVGVVIMHSGYIPSTVFFDSQGQPISNAFDSLPSGYLLCDGSAVSRYVFEELYNVIGVTYGNPGNTTFNLPDFRGLFPRGTTRETQTDKEWWSRGFKTTTGNLNEAQKFRAGSFQQESIKNHAHQLPAGYFVPGPVQHHYVDWSVLSPRNYDSFVMFGNSPISPSDAWSYKNTYENGGSETRPANFSVNFLIKYSNTPLT